MRLSETIRDIHMETVLVVDLYNGNEYGYIGITPIQALITAFAYFKMKNGNTWEHEEKYSHLVKISKSGKTASIGDLCVTL